MPPGHALSQRIAKRSGRPERIESWNPQRQGGLRASAELDLEQFREGAAPGEKLGPPPRLDDPPLVHDDDAIRLARSAEAMGDDDRGDPAGEHLQGPPNRGFGRVVNRVGGLVEDQDLRAAQQGTCERNALSFAARELCASHPDGRVVALGQGLDEVVDVRLHGHGANPLRGASGSP